MRSVPIGLQSYDRNFESLSVERLINCHVEQSPQSATTQIPVVGVPGHLDVVTVGDGPIRAARRWRDHTYVVSGPELWRYDDTFTTEKIGDIAGNDRVTMDVMSDAVVLVSGGRYYSTDGLTVTEQTIPAFTGFDPIPDSVTVINNTAVIGFLNTDYYTWTAPNQPGSINAIDIARAERKADITIRVYSDNNELLLFGAESIEVKYDSAVATGRWKSIGNGLIERGCSAFGSIATMDNTTMWLGDDFSIYRLNGRTPQRISTHWFEYQVQEMDRVDDAFAFGHTYNGHKLYTITFPTEGRTFVIDLNTGLPHERRSWERPYYRGKTAMPKVGTRSLVGSAFDGVIFQQVNERFQEGTGTIERLIRTPYMYSEEDAVLAIHEIKLTLDTGRGSADNDTSEAKMMMRYTFDGRNWSNERMVTISNIGEYGVKVKWGQLGQSQTGRVAFEFRLTNSIPFRIVAARANIDPGQ